jgi:hypothetical protein
MKNIILQHYTGKLGELEKLSQESMMNYANECGADYHLINGNKFHPKLSAPCQKIHMLSEEFDEYDIVVMVDIDMFRRIGATGNIFTDDKGIGRHTKIQDRLVNDLQKRFPNLGNSNYPYFGGSIYRLEKDIRLRLRRHLVESEYVKFHNNYEDEGIMHRLCVLEKLPITGSYLNGDKWNRSSFEKDVHIAEIIHIRTKVTPNGPKRTKMENYLSLKERGLI